MNYVLGIDLGTSAVKIVLVNQEGQVVDEVSKDYPLYHEKSGYSEQDPDDWVKMTLEGLSEIVTRFSGSTTAIEGMSFSGQMHGLVLLDENQTPLRRAILWNDTRTTKQCHDIEEVVGRERLLSITQNRALEGFTLPKIMWVKEHEPVLFQQAKSFLLPKDYVRLKLTGKLQMEYSDAAGTLLLDIQKSTWSTELIEILDLPATIFPELVESTAFVGHLSDEVARQTGLSPTLKVYAGGADNACGAIGAGVSEQGQTMVSIGTSGVVLSFEQNADKDFGGKVHYFHHSVPNSFYSMGVTLAAGYSLSWFKDVFAKDEPFEHLLAEVGDIPVGANGLLFTPYLVGERTPHADSTIRASFIGMDSSHKRAHFVRAVLEGITFSLNESIDLFRSYGKQIDRVISIGGGSKSAVWLQMQADVFNAKVVKLKSEQGPGMGAAMIAAFGSGWFDTLKQCSDAFLDVDQTFEPIPENVEQYQQLFHIYQGIYVQTKELHQSLALFKK